MKGLYHDFKVSEILIENLMKISEILTEILKNVFETGLMTLTSWLSRFDPNGSYGYFVVVFEFALKQYAAGSKFVL